MHVLLVDDHALFREGLKFILRGLDEHLLIDEAGSVDAAVAMQEVPPFDLILLDLNLPGVGDLEALASVRAAFPQAPIVVLSGEDERVVLLTRPVTVLGRGADADLRLPDTGVSRAHAELRLDGGTARVVDLQSTNGTLLNGRRIRIATLRDGDRLDLGATSMVYRSEG